MNVRDIMVSRILTVPEEASVQEAACIMADSNVGSLVVTNVLGSYVGMITERDFVKRVAARGRSSVTTPVAEIMSTKLITVDEETSLAEAARVMEEHNIRRLLVTVRGKIRGILTNRLLLKHIRYNIAEGLVKRDQNTYHLNEY